MNNVKKLSVLLVALSTISVQALINDPSKEFEELKNEAAIALNLHTRKDYAIRIRNGKVTRGLVQTWGRIHDDGVSCDNIIVDEEQFVNAPLCVKRWAVYHAMAHAVHGDSYNYYFKEFKRDNPDSLHVNFHNAERELATASVFNPYLRMRKNCAFIHSVQDIVRRADITAFNALECEQCCLECADFVSRKNTVLHHALHTCADFLECGAYDMPLLFCSTTTVPSIFDGYLSPQEIHEFAKQHAGKCCKHHAPHIVQS